MPLQNEAVTNPTVASKESEPSSPDSLPLPAFVLQFCNLRSQPPNLFCGVLDVHLLLWTMRWLRHTDGCFVAQPFQKLQNLLQKRLFAGEVGLDLLDPGPRSLDEFQGGMQPLSMDARDCSVAFLSAS